MKKSIIILLLLGIIGIFALINLGQQRIFQVSECYYPCWKGLRPGVTSEAETYRLLQSNPLVKRNSVTVLNETKNIFSNVYYCGLTNGVHLTIYFIDKKISIMYFDNIRYLSFQNATQIFGMPEYIFTVLTPEHRFWLWQELFLGAVEPQRGVSYGYTGYYLSIIQSFYLLPISSVDWLLLFDPNIYRIVLRDKWISHGWLDQNSLEKVKRNWMGYGNTVEKYPFWDYSKIK